MKMGGDRREHRLPLAPAQSRLGRELQGVRPVGATLAVATAGYVALVTFALLLGVLVTRFVVGGTLGRGDLQVARWFAERRSDFRNDLSLVGTYFAETVTVLVILVVVLAVLAIRRHWPLFVLLALSLSLEPLVYLAATYVISRNRPAVPRLESLIVADSFPSGHTAAAVALYGSLAIIVCAETRRRLWRAPVLILAVAAPIIVATSRVYRGMHNPTDVVSGALIGAACIAVSYVAVWSGMAVAVARREAAARSAPTRALLATGASEPAPEPAPSAVRTLEGRR
jgi:membrane-associated phospholipid phosphatase